MNVKLYTKLLNRIASRFARLVYKDSSGDRFSAVAITPSSILLNATTLIDRL